MATIFYDWDCLMPHSYRDGNDITRNEGSGNDITGKSNEIRLLWEWTKLGNTMKPGKPSQSNEAAIIWLSHYKIAIMGFLNVGCSALV